jgi:hypothetical protein
MFAEMDTPESKLKFEEDDRFLRQVVYAGLRDLNVGFDSPLICHFSPVDFLTVISRCESLHVRVIGIEIFTSLGCRNACAAGTYAKTPQNNFPFAWTAACIRHHYLYL